MNVTKKVSGVSDAPKPRNKNRRSSREATLIESMQHIGNETTVGCVTHCRYGEEVRHTWQECLDRCVENSLMRSAMMKMLPAEQHAAVSMDVEVPDSLQKQLE